ncbi:MAG: hypothetical protein O3A08_09655 [Proteobacteria bacterium]|nr:hypothetical protein [Pseudomonadota bacterium]MDA1286674.1 hypothetical protein [Pseudomonadota bacterium]
MRMNRLIATVLTAGILAVSPGSITWTGGAAWADVISSEVLFRRKAWE